MAPTNTTNPAGLIQIKGLGGNPAQPAPAPQGSTGGAHEAQASSMIKIGAATMGQGQQEQAEIGKAAPAQ